MAMIYKFRKAQKEKAQKEKVIKKIIKLMEKEEITWVDIYEEIILGEFK